MASIGPFARLARPFQLLLLGPLRRNERSSGIWRGVAPTRNCSETRDLAEHGRDACREPLSQARCQYARCCRPARLQIGTGELNHRRTACSAPARQSRLAARLTRILTSSLSGTHAPRPAAEPLTCYEI